MDYDRWWALHLRVAKNEPLSQGEQAFSKLVYGNLRDESAAPDADFVVPTCAACFHYARQPKAELAVRSRELDREMARQISYSG
ncbi:MAG: hypothetical protein R2851_14235 [Caldilineaceae bacterium]